MTRTTSRRPTADPYTVAPEYNAGCTLSMTGHTEWVDGAVHETGLTTAWTPNQADPRAGNAGAGPRPDRPARERAAARPSPRSPPGATTPAGSTSCSATAPSGSSRTSSTARPGGPWARWAAERSSAPTPIEAPPAVARAVGLAKAVENTRPSGAHSACRPGGVGTKPRRACAIRDEAPSLRTWSSGRTTWPGRSGAGAQRQAGR